MILVFVAFLSVFCFYPCHITAAMVARLAQVDFVFEQSDLDGVEGSILSQRLRNGDGIADFNDLRVSLKSFRVVHHMLKHRQKRLPKVSLTLFPEDLSHLILSFIPDIRHHMFFDDLCRLGLQNHFYTGDPWQKKKILDNGWIVQTVFLKGVEFSFLSFQKPGEEFFFQLSPVTKRQFRKIMGFIPNDDACEDSVMTDVTLYQAQNFVQILNEECRRNGLLGHFQLPKYRQWSHAMSWSKNQFMTQPMDKARIWLFGSYSEWSGDLCPRGRSLYLNVRGQASLYPGMERPDLGFRLVRMMNS